MNAQSMPLQFLLERLRSEGLLVGVDAHVRVNRLLRLEASWEQRRLQVALRAILVTGPEESVRFDQIFEETFGNPGAAPRGTGVTAEEAPVLAITGPNTPSPRRFRRRWAAFALASVLVLAAVGAAWLRHHSQTLEESVTEIPVQEQVVPLPAPATLAEGRFVLDKGTVTLGGVMVGLACVLAVAAWIIALRRGRNRKRYWPGPWTLRIRPPKAPRWFSEEDIECTAGVLAPARHEQSEQLDVDVSIAATAEAGGMPVLRYSRQKRYPRVAFVLDRSGPAIGWRPVFDELGNRLQRAGVALERFEFDSHLDQVFPVSPAGEPVKLARLAEEHDTLVVVGDGSGARDPLSGRRSEWVDELGSFPGGLWINPLPRGEWSLGMRVLEERIPVAEPAALLGTRSVLGAYATLPPIALSAPAAESAQEALREYLGSAFPVFHASVLTGLPDPHVTLWAATQLKPRPGQRWMFRLLSLPWFRAGVWPSGLPEVVRASLARSPQHGSWARRIQTFVLQASEPPAGSLAHLHWRLRRALAGVDGEEVTPELRRELRASPLADVAHGEMLERRLPGLGARDVPALVCASLLLLVSAGWVMRDPYIFEESDKIAIETAPPIQGEETHSDDTPGSSKVARSDASARALTSAAGTRVTVDSTLDCAQLQRRTKPPQVRMGAQTVNGRIPPEIITRVVRLNYGRFRLCFENGLRSNPELQGRVAVRFVIGRDGSVSNVSNGGSDMPDPAVVQCIARSFYGLSFPQPEGGIVTVVYPMAFGRTVPRAPSVGLSRGRDESELVGKGASSQSSGAASAAFSSDGITEVGPISVEQGADEPFALPRPDSRHGEHLSLRSPPEVPGGLLERQRLAREAGESEERKRNLNAKRAAVGLAPCP